MTSSEWSWGGLRQGFYDVIVANPDWPYELRSEKGEAKSHASKFGGMPLDQIKALRVGELARMPSILLLCAIAPMLPEAIETIAAWGFVFKSEMVWRKITRSGKPRPGPGYRVRTMHQPILVATLGSPQHKPFPSVIDGVLRKHSQLPDELFKVIEQRCPSRWYVDLFAQQERPSWDSWRYVAGRVEPVVSVQSLPPSAEGRQGALILPFAAPERAA